MVELAPNIASPKACQAAGTEIAPAGQSTNGARTAARRAASPSTPRTGTETAQRQPHSRSTEKFCMTPFDGRRMRQVLLHHKEIRSECAQSCMSSMIAASNVKAGSAHKSTWAMSPWATLMITQLHLSPGRTDTLHGAASRSKPWRCVQHNGTSPALFGQFLQFGHHQPWSRQAAAVPRAARRAAEGLGSRMPGWKAVILRSLAPVGLLQDQAKISPSSSDLLLATAPHRGVPTRSSPARRSGM